MELRFDQSLSTGYKSSAQKIRVMSESWLGENMYCPNCGNPKISHLANNSPVADFQCDNCGEIYELNPDLQTVPRSSIIESLQDRSDQDEKPK